MKHSIAWHKEGLGNLNRYLGEELRRRERIDEHIERLKAETSFYSHQIDEALRFKKDSFDAAKFRRTKKGKAKCELPY